MIKRNHKASLPINVNNTSFIYFEVMYELPMAPTIEFWNVNPLIAASCLKLFIEVASLLGRNIRSANLLRGMGV